MTQMLTKFTALGDTTDKFNRFVDNKSKSGTVTNINNTNKTKVNHDNSNTGKATASAHTKNHASKKLKEGKPTAAGKKIKTTGVSKTGEAPRVVSTYTHNPYAPVELLDSVDAEYVVYTPENCDLYTASPHNGVGTSSITGPAPATTASLQYGDDMGYDYSVQSVSYDADASFSYSPNTPAYDVPQDTHSHSVAATPSAAPDMTPTLQDVTSPRIVYVNGRPVVTTSATTPEYSEITPVKRRPVTYKHNVSASKVSNNGSFGTPPAAGYLHYGTPATHPMSSPADLSLHEVQDLSFEKEVSGEEEVPPYYGGAVDHSQYGEAQQTTETDMSNNNASHDAQEEAAHAPLELVAVQFHERCSKYYSAIDPAIGEYVVVEGDRGYDVGRVVSKQPKPEGTHCYERREGVRRAPLWVVRLATAEEVHTTQTEQVALEEAALAKIRAEAQRLGLPMDVKSCEFQFDRMKLSFYFEAFSQVHFVPLLKSLHKEFQCRIWLQQVNRETKRRGGSVEHQE